LTGPLGLSCILPAPDKASRIGAVLAVALEPPEVDEVIVVDDGSTNATVAVVEAWAQRFVRLKLIGQPENAGKTRAVIVGLRAARGRNPMLRDSDLIGPATAHLSRRASPILQGCAGAAISLQGNAPESRQAVERRIRWPS
jgi:glycosyltransferase involved in cell wall biosynthesis